MSFTLGSNSGIRNSERKKKEKEKAVMPSLQHNRPLSLLHCLFNAKYSFAQDQAHERQ